jgi:hypothetical protein
MSPRAVGTGKIRLRAVGDFPAYVNSHDRDKDNVLVFVLELCWVLV